MMGVAYSEPRSRQIASSYLQAGLYTASFFNKVKTNCNSTNVNNKTVINWFNKKKN
jgi:hypothetical protein